MGSQRSKEALSCVPWFAKKAAKAALEGKEPEYWLSLWLSGVNSLRPANASFTANPIHQRQAVSVVALVGGGINILVVGT